MAGMLKCLRLILATDAVLVTSCALPVHAQQHTQLINESVRLMGSGKFAEAVETGERAVKAAEERLGPDHVEVATALNNLSEFLQIQAFVQFGKDEAKRQAAFARAEVLQKRALAIREKHLGSRHSFTLASVVNLARIYLAQGRYDEAEPIYKRAKESLDEIGPRAPILGDLARQVTAGLNQIDKERKKTPAVAQPAAVEKTYANQDHRWSVSYPGNWKLEDNDRSFVKLSRGAAVLGIHTFSDIAGTSPDAVADAAIQRWERNMRNVNAFTQVSRQRLTLAGDLPAVEFVHHIGTSVAGKSRKIIVAAKGRVFGIDAETFLASWPEYEREFNQIIGSFRRTDSARATRDRHPARPSCRCSTGDLFR